MYVLLISIVVGYGTGSPVALTQVSGFKSQDQCETQSNRVINILDQKNNKLTVNTVCIEITNVSNYKK